MKTKWNLLHWPFLEGMVKVLMWGAENHKDKGSVGGWRGASGYRYSKEGLQESMMRHLVAMINGEELDSETNLPHAFHIGCNLNFYDYFHLSGLKPKQNEQINTIPNHSCTCHSESIFGEKTCGCKP